VTLVDLVTEVSGRLASIDALLWIVMGLQIATLCVVAFRDKKK
jgi:hypothetical protein